MTRGSTRCASGTAARGSHRARPGPGRGTRGARSACRRGRPPAAGGRCRRGGPPGQVEAEVAVRLAGDDGVVDPVHVGGNHAGAGRGRAGAGMRTLPWLNIAVPLSRISKTMTPATGRDQARHGPSLMTAESGSRPDGSARGRDVDVQVGVVHPCGGATAPGRHGRPRAGDRSPDRAPSRDRSSSQAGTAAHCSSPQPPRPARAATPTASSGTSSFTQALLSAAMPMLRPQRAAFGSRAAAGRRRLPRAIAAKMPRKKASRRADEPSSVSMFTPDPRPSRRLGACQQLEPGGQPLQVLPLLRRQQVEDFPGLAVRRCRQHPQVQVVGVGLQGDAVLEQLGRGLAARPFKGPRDLHPALHQRIRRLVPQDPLREGRRRPSTGHPQIEAAQLLHVGLLRVGELCEERRGVRVAGRPADPRRRRASRPPGTRPARSAPPGARRR